VKDPGAVAKAGITPKQGQAKVLFGNINDAAATITFNSKAINVAAGTGVKNPSTARQVQIFHQAPGQALQSDGVELGVDEVWG